MVDWTEIAALYLFPTIGTVTSTALYLAPAKDLSECLRNRSLGYLNPFPWAVMAGNSIGWLAYGWYAKEAFVWGSNVPGLLVAFWLNVGASKLQYYAQTTAAGQDDDDREGLSPSCENGGRGGARSQSIAAAVAAAWSQFLETPFAFAPQDILMMKVSSFWIAVLWLVGWSGIFSEKNLDLQADIVGFFANLNCLAMYAAPLQAMRSVLSEKRSDRIHTPTVALSITNALVWFLYGMALGDIFLCVPCFLGLLLGLAQAALCCLYPKSGGYHSGLVRGRRINVDDFIYSDELSLTPTTTAAVSLSSDGSSIGDDVAGVDKTPLLV